MCAAVPVRALLQLPLLGVERGYKGLYGGGWPLRGMGAAGTALGAADARTNEHYEIGTILTQFSHCALGDPSPPTPSVRVLRESPMGSGGWGAKNEQGRLGRGGSTLKTADRGGVFSHRVLPSA